MRRNPLGDELFDFLRKEWVGGVGCFGDDWRRRGQGLITRDGGNGSRGWEGEGRIDGTRREDSRGRRMMSGRGD